MKILIFLLSISSLVVADLTKWQRFKVNHNKFFKSVIEERLRYKIFQNNLKEIAEHNAKYDQGLVSFKKGINQFTDMTKAEFLGYLKLSGAVPKSVSSKLHESTEAAPNEIDWTNLGAVTPVKDEGSCGACWAFTATGSLEGQYQITTGKLVSLSEQNLIDCSSSYGNLGCCGGYMDSSFEYVRDYGINSEEDYPYEAVDGICRFSSNSSILNVQSFRDIRTDDETDLINAVGTVGPVSSAIEATAELQMYESGIFNDTTCSKDRLNYAFLVVGYGTDESTDYWLIKNSWGTSWGESGYVRFVRGSNLCGIATMASYPKL